MTVVLRNLRSLAITIIVLLILVTDVYAQKEKYFRYEIQTPAAQHFSFDSIQFASEESYWLASEIILRNNENKDSIQAVNINRNRLQITLGRQRKAMGISFEKNSIVKRPTFFKKNEYNNYFFSIDSLEAVLFPKVLDSNYQTVVHTEYRVNDLGVYGINFSTIKILPYNNLNVDFMDLNGKFIKVGEFEGENAIRFTLVTCDSIEITGISSTAQLSFTACKFNTIYLNSLSINSSLQFARGTLPQTLRIEKLDFNNSDANIDLRQLTSKELLNCKLYIVDTDPTRILLNYSQFNLVFENIYGQEISEHNKENIYKAILESQKKEGYLDGFEKIDKEFKQFEYLRKKTFAGIIQNAFSKWWWDYGYNKKLIILRSLQLMLIFFLINLFWYPSLLLEGYEIIELVKADRNIRRKYFGSWKLNAIRSLHCLLFTTYIFWGIKVNFEKIKLNSPLIAFLISVEYIVGLICLAWVANYIITA